MLLDTAKELDGLLIILKLVFGVLVTDMHGRVSCGLISDFFFLFILCLAMYKRFPTEQEEDV